MKIDIEVLQEAVKQVKEAFEVIAKWLIQTFMQAWERLKGITLDYIEYKLEQPERPVYGYVKHRAMKSQVMNRKPMLIRARTTC